MVLRKSNRDARERHKLSQSIIGSNNTPNVSYDVELFLKLESLEYLATSRDLETKKGSNPPGFIIIVHPDKSSSNAHGEVLVGAGQISAEIWILVCMMISTSHPDLGSY